MAMSRLRRFEERRQRRRLVLPVLGILTLLAFLGIFGLRLLVVFSIMIDRLRGSSPQQQTQTILLAPVLNPIPAATNSAALAVNGIGTAGASVIIYVNESERKKVIISDEGTFFLSPVKLSEGTNTISARITDEKGNASDLSNVLTIFYKKTPPSLDIASPVDGAVISGEPKNVTVSGTTDEQVSVTVNGRLVFVRLDGSFVYEYPLSDGETILTIVATDTAGNQTIVERKVTYKP